MFAYRMKKNTTYSSLLALNYYWHGLFRGIHSEKPADVGNSSVATDVVSRLKALAELKDQGILTEEEFTAMKKKILEE